MIRDTSVDDPPYEPWLARSCDRTASRACLPKASARGPDPARPSSPSLPCIGYDPRMRAVPEFDPSDLTGDLIGFPLALMLLGATAALLHPGQRVRVRQGAVLLGLSVLCFALRFTFASGASAHRLLLFIGAFCLFGSMGRSAVLLVIDVVVDRRSARPSPRIFRDLSTGVTYLAVALLALRTIGVEPGSILATSAVLTAVVGLAMQDTLGNFVSGLALQLQRPFDVGDWIEVGDGAQAGRVTEVTWRATSVMTLDHVEVILPNATLAKAAIRNYSRPSTVSRRRVLVNVTYAAPPDEVHDALTTAARNVPGVLSSPIPQARTRAFGDSAVEYELLFFVNDFGEALNVDGAVRDRVFYTLLRRGIDIPFPTQTIAIRAATEEPDQRLAHRARRAAAVSAVGLLRPLPDDARHLLAARATLRLFGPGETIVCKGDPSVELFIIERGIVTVEVPREGGASHEVSQLGPGQCFGEMGLLTGEVRSATVRAKTLCHLVALDQEAFHQVLAAHPEVVEGLGSLLASRQAELARAAVSESSAPPAEERSRRLITQIRQFFGLSDRPPR